MAEPLVLTLACADRPGITARVTGFLFERGCNILDAQQFNDRSEAGGTDRFFMRVVFEPADGDAPAAIREAFETVAGRFDMDWTLRGSEPRRVMILTSRFDHCLADLLYRWRIDELPMKVTAILRPLGGMSQTDALMLLGIHSTK